MKGEVVVVEEKEVAIEDIITLEREIIYQIVELEKEGIKPTILLIPCTQYYWLRQYIYANERGVAMEDYFNKFGITNIIHHNKVKEIEVY